LTAVTVTGVEIDEAMDDTFEDEVGVDGGSG
jgi:hypothetical protein